MLNVNQITPPRVPLVDLRTGNITREWYRFISQLFDAIGGLGGNLSLEYLQVAPPATDYSNEIAALEDLQVAPPAEPVVVFEALQVAPPAEPVVVFEDPLEPKAQPALLSQLQDVGAFNPADGDKLIFNGATSRWEKIPEAT